MNPRLLRPTRAETAALAHSNDAFESMAGISVLEGWAGSPARGQDLLAATGCRSADTSIWCLIIDHGHLAGIAGFKRPPTSESVEIAYAVAPVSRSRALATWAVAELITRVRRAQTRHVVARTLPTKNASTRVLQCNGYNRTGLVPDPDRELPDGVWHWTRPTKHTPATSNQGQP